MNTLLSNSIFPYIEKWTELKTIINSILSGKQNFPVEIEGLQGSFHTFFTSFYISSKQSSLLNNMQYTATGRYSQGSAAAGTSTKASNPNNKELIKSGFSLTTASADIMIVVPTEKEALDVYTDFKACFSDNVEIYRLPWWGLVAYRPAAKGAVTFGQRSGVLSKLASSNNYKNTGTKPRIFIVTIRSLLTPVPPADYIKSLSMHIQNGQTINTVELAEKLVQLGYIRVPKVTVRGEFALRGEVLDIFLPDEEVPHRIQFDFDQIEKIKTFDSNTQTTISAVEKLIICPMKEVIWNDEFVQILEDKLNLSDKTLSPKAVEAGLKLIDELKTSRESEGEELFYSLLWNEKHCITEYLSENTEIFFYDFDRLNNYQESLEREYVGMYKKTRPDFPVLLPNEIMFTFSSVLPLHQKSIYYKSLHTQAEGEKEEKTALFIDCEPSQGFFGNINYLKEQISSLQNDGWKIYIYTDNENQSLRINEILKDFTEPAEKPELFPVKLLPLAISEGFSIPELKIKVIQENELFGRRKQSPKSLKKVKSEAIDSFVDMNPGDYIVHVNYGIGIFKGIERVKSMGNERDYMKIEYADEEFIFVPIEQVNLVQRYIGNEGNAPKIDRIGSKSWENRKNRVKQAVEDLAQKLIDLYSRRKISHGFPFPKDTEWQLAFEASFPYEDTPDQITVTKEIKDDMEKPVPMDRLICGDVGYGKTEIAMRAAFKAVMGGKQVAFLAPTTILAEQHYETCKERFSNFPVKIAQLSRFVSHAEQKKTIEKLAAGEIDVLVGTHRIIQKDVVFKNLGLMIIDEEQRFGVKDKEKLKTLKNNVDSLAMSATPIPRTLHMSLLKIRDMSLLTTPPQSRQPIETVISEYDDDYVIKAIRKEIERGGQVFYLHNRVESLNEIRIKLEKLMPELLVDVAHGQMTSDELDDIFRRFKMGGFHVLISTTIIENGIDIPNVNTIIIDRADMYGVSQLYQLRGRVGRSDRKAYAYLFYPKNKALSEIAMKRLQVISDFTELGSGFKIAMKDMEIRGAGNLLGRDQSGNVYSVGFDLYLRLLNEAVQRLTMENYSERTEVLMELEYTGFIPDSYVSNPQTKMEIYKKIASVQEKDELESVSFELEDRFGPIPDEVSSLLALAEIRIICRQLEISVLKEHAGLVRITFDKMSLISIDKVLKLIQTSAGRVRLDSAHPNQIILATGKISLKEKSEFIREKLSALV